jgi:anaerobic magnesium-protoporphyrin IX monomethyl ester cyclase
MVCDAPVEKENLEELRRKFESFSPDMVGMTAFTPQIWEAHEVARMAKEVDKDVRTVIGGAHVSAVPGETLEQFRAFDVAVVGEGERTVRELARFLSRGAPVQATVPGTVCRTADGVRSAPPRDPADNLDEIVFPAFELFPLPKYRSGNTLLGRKRTLPVLASRGCTYKCRFCFSLLGKKARFRSPGNVAEEIQRDIERFQAEQIFFQDETFSIDRERAVSLCEEFLRRGFHKKIRWMCETRVDAVDQELLMLMRRSGCTLINYGIESGCQEILDTIGKEITLEQAARAVSLTRESGIRVYANFLFGHPFETRERIQSTIRLALALNPDFASFSIMTPFPGTEIRKMAQERTGGLRLLSGDWRDYGTQFGKALELENVSRNELERFQKQAYAAFYSRHPLNLCRIIDFRNIPVYAYQFFLKNPVRRGT